MWLKEAIWNKCPEKWKIISWFLHHDTRSVHTSLVQLFLTPQKITVIPYPPYLFDLAPCAFFPFPMVKLWLKGCWDNMNEDIMAEMMEIFDVFMLEKFYGCMESWGKFLNCCIIVINRTNFSYGKTFFFYSKIP